MTTTVIVKAHCSDAKQVRITKKNADNGAQTETVIQNGESNDQVVYDGWEISVKEELK